MTANILHSYLKYALNAYNRGLRTVTICFTTT
nr:MAG TPA: hypothetical protein [Caudoviricetes sp.]